jgi:enolase-phosphatase E1
VSASSPLEGIHAILLDIEGTTTPIAFVFEVLYPYARRHLRPHLERHATSPEYAALFDRLRDDYSSDRNAGEDVPSWIDGPPAARLAPVASYCEWLMDRDRKSTALKELQGKIWEEGYRRGELVADVFPEVPRALERWSGRHLQIGIFSSGSRLAQQLFFQHSSAGDLTRHLRCYFDTTIGKKTDPESYRHIANAMSLPPEAVLFVSDVTGELDAARRAGMHTTLSMRPGNKPPPAGHSHRVIQTFDGLG